LSPEVGCKRRLCRTVSNYGDWSREIYKQIKKSCPSLKMLVLDFDLTITREHTGGYEFLSNDPIVRSASIMSNVRNATIIRDLIYFLIDKKIKIAVCSKADTFYESNYDPATIPIGHSMLSGKALIMEYLLTIFGGVLPLDSNAIIAFNPGTFSDAYYMVCKELHICPWQYDVSANQKNIHLMYLSRMYNISPKDIALIDDDAEVVKCADKMFHGIHLEQLAMF
jgi:hypothetical protein